MSYTQGPLTIKGPSAGIIRGIDDGGDYAIIKDGRIIGEAIHKTSANDREDAKANAKLWALAPTLLEACKIAASSCCCSINERLSGHLINCFVPYIEDLIAQIEENE